MPEKRQDTVTFCTVAIPQRALETLTMRTSSGGYYFPGRVRGVVVIEHVRRVWVGLHDLTMRRSYSMAEVTCAMVSLSSYGGLAGDVVDSVQRAPR